MTTTPAVDAALTEWARDFWPDHDAFMAEVYRLADRAHRGDLLARAELEAAAREWAPALGRALDFADQATREGFAVLALSDRHDRARHWDELAEDLDREIAIREGLDALPALRALLEARR